MNQNQKYGVTPFVINTDDFKETVPKEGIWEARLAMYEKIDQRNEALASVLVLGYNRLVKTKYCVECVLKYTCEIDMELILVDNGSNDGTLEYFQSVPWEKKVIIRITKNVGSAFPWHIVKRIYTGKYLVTVANDVYVTKNWLSNLLICMESDPQIGYVVPVSSNVSNLQQVDFIFQTMEEMQEAAAKFNLSDPSKWEERMRLISIVTVSSKALLDLVGTPDYGFAHDFGEDDYAARIRRAGLKLMLCKDTYVCHDHDFRRGEDKDLEAYACSLQQGRKDYQEKYRGMDAWNDILNFESELISQINPYHFNRKQVNVLGVDIKCGTPLLEIKNQFRRNKRNAEINSFLFTTEARYYVELLNHTEAVCCDRIDFIQESYEVETMDIVFLGEPINLYSNPLALVKKLLGFVKKGGIFLFKIRNTDDYESLLRCLKLGGHWDGELPIFLPIEAFNKCLSYLQVSDVRITANPHSYDAEFIKGIEQFFQEHHMELNDARFEQLITQDYLYYAKK